MGFADIVDSFSVPAILRKDENFDAANWDHQSSGTENTSQVSKPFFHTTACHVDYFAVIAFVLML
jgi:hypothetical protein